MIIEVKAEYQTTPKWKTINVHARVYGVPGSETIHEVEAPNDGWKTHQFVEVPNNASAREVSNLFAAHLKKTVANVVPGSVKIMKLTQVDVTSLIPGGNT